MNCNYLIILYLILLSSASFAQKDSINFEVARELNLEGRYDEALPYIDKAIKQNPSNHIYYDEKAWSLKGLDKSYDAIRCLNNGVDKNPKNPYFFFIRGRFYVTSIDFEVAILDLDRALDLVTEEKDLKIKILRNRGLAKSYIKDSIGAFADFYHALEVDSNNVLTMSDLSITYMAFGNYKKAIEYLSKAYKINPDNKYILSNLGYLYTLTGEYKQAVGIFNKSISIFPNISGNYNNRGYAFLNLGKMEEAEKDIEFAIFLDPENSYAYRNKALLHIERAEISLACKNLQMAEELGYTKQYDNKVVELMKKYCE